MKKFLSLVMLVMVTMTASAQHWSYAPSHSRLERSLDGYDMYCGFRIGYNSSSLRFSETDAISLSTVPGMNFGMVLGFPLGNSPLIFESGLIYTVKGGKTQSKALAKTKVFMHGFELPLVLKYDIEIASMDGLSIQPLFGAYLNMGLGGRTKYELGTVREKFKTFSHHQFHRLDAGLRMGCGFNIDFFYVEAAYDLGLTDLGRETERFQKLFPGAYDGGWDDKIRTGSFNLTVGVNF